MNNYMSIGAHYISIGILFTLCRAFVYSFIYKSINDFDMLKMISIVPLWPIYFVFCVVQCIKLFFEIMRELAIISMLLFKRLITIFFD